MRISDWSSDVCSSDLRGVTAPLPAAGYELPLEVTDPGDAAELAVRMESDTATAWRAVTEQAQTPEDRRFAVTAMTQAAVLARSEERRVGKEGVRTCRSWWSP